MRWQDNDELRVDTVLDAAGRKVTLPRFEGRTKEGLANRQS
jgi:hypothetical protein